jgi:hypothetical protein
MCSFLKTILGQFIVKPFKHIKYAKLLSLLRHITKKKKKLTMKSFIERA